MACDDLGWSHCRFLQLLLADPCLDLRPLFLPAIGTDDVSQGQHRVDMAFGPMHSSAFQSSFDHQLVAALDESTPDRPALRLKYWIMESPFESSPPPPKACGRPQSITLAANAACSGVRHKRIPPSPDVRVFDDCSENEPK